eukprot:scpid106552/ scgid32517/ 
MIHCSDNGIVYTSTMVVVVIVNIKYLVHSMSNLNVEEAAAKTDLLLQGNVSVPSYSIIQVFFPLKRALPASAILIGCGCIGSAAGKISVRASVKYGPCLCPCLCRRLVSFHWMKTHLK